MILDTNGLSSVADGDAALEPILRKATEVAVPVIVLGEYRYGIQQSRDRQHYEQWLTETIHYYRVLDVDEETVISYATIRTELKRAGTPIPKVQRWFRRHPRFHMHFTPTSASWLNMVERFFRDLTQNRLRRGVFRDLEELIIAIGSYIDRHNENLKPFVWTARDSDILEKVKRARRALNKRQSA